MPKNVAWDESILCHTTYFWIKKPLKPFFRLLIVHIFNMYLTIIYSNIQRSIPFDYITFYQWSNQHVGQKWRKWRGLAGRGSVFTLGGRRVLFTPSSAVSSYPPPAQFQWHTVVKSRARLDKATITRWVWSCKATPIVKSLTPQMRNPLHVGARQLQIWGM